MYEVWTSERLTGTLRDEKSGLYRQRHQRFSCVVPRLLSVAVGCCRLTFRPSALCFLFRSFTDSDGGTTFSGCDSIEENGITYAYYYPDEDTTQYLYETFPEVRRAMVRVAVFGQNISHLGHMEHRLNQVGQVDDDLDNRVSHLPLWEVVQDLHCIIDSADLTQETYATINTVGHADYTGPTGQHELDHADHTRSRIDLP